MRMGRPKCVGGTHTRMGHAYCTIRVWAILYAYGPSYTRMGQNMHMVHNISLSQEGTNTGLNYWNGLLDWYILVFNFILHSLVQGIVI